MLQTAAAKTEYRQEPDSRAQLEAFTFHFPPDPARRDCVSVEYIPEAGGKPRQLFYCYVDELPAKLATMEVLPYLNYYITGNTTRGKKRGNDKIFRLLNIFMDLDCHSETVSPERREWLVTSFRQFLEYKGLPVPCNTIHETGRGLHIVWAIDPVSYKMRKAYRMARDFLREDVEKVLQEWRKFYKIDPQEFGFDKNASNNDAGIIRIPGTYNTKTAPRKMATAKQIHKNRLDIIEFNGRRIAALINERQSSEGKNWDNILKFPTSAAYLAGARVAVLFNLQTMRAAAGRPISKGMRDALIFCVYCVLASAGVSHEAAMQRVNTVNSRFPEPMTSDEIKSSLSSAVTKKYKLPNQYIIDALEITPQEQNALRFYKGGSRLNNTREQLAEAARKKKEGRDEAILAHYEKGETLQQIADVVGCTAPTVRNVLKRAGRASRSDTLRARIRILYQQGKAPAEIAEATGAHLSTVYRHINAARENGEILATDERNAEAGEYIKARPKTATEAAGTAPAAGTMKRAGQDPAEIRSAAVIEAAKIWPQSAENIKAGVFIHQQAETATAATAATGIMKRGTGTAAGQGPGVAAPVFAKIKKSPPIGLVTVTDKQLSNSIDTAKRESPEEIRERLRAKIDAQRPVMTAEQAESRRRLIEHMKRNREKWARQGLDPLPLSWPARTNSDRLRE